MRTIKGAALVIGRHVKVHWKILAVALFVYAAWLPAVSWVLCKISAVKYSWALSLTGMFPNAGVLVATAAMSFLLTLLTVMVTPLAYKDLSNLARRRLTPKGRARAQKLRQEKQKVVEDKLTLRTAQLEEIIKPAVEELASLKGANLFEATLMAHEVLGLIEENSRKAVKVGAERVAG